MMRFVLSAIYVSANLLASLLVVILIARTAGELDRTAFFLFQAVYFPLTTLLAQSQMLMRFQNAEMQGLGFAVDAAMFAATLALLLSLGPHLFTTTEAALYAAAVPLTYRGTTLQAGVQFDETRAVFALVPAGTAVARVAACLAVLTLGAAPAFFASSAVYFLVPLSVDMCRRRNRGNAPRTKAGIGHLLTLFAFFTCASFTFQWERMVFARTGMEELIVASGVCMTWMLSPLSAIFATLYRADARAIFELDQVAFRDRVYLRRAAVFLAFAGLYLGASAMLWHPLNALTFPFFQGPAYWPVLLGAAIVVDRLGHLAVFIGNRLPLYRRAAAVKLLLIMTGVAVVLALGQGVTLTIVYATYLALEMLYLAVVLTLAIRAGSPASAEARPD